MHIKELVNEHRDLIIKLRRDLHRIPETGFTESKTSSYVASYLEKEGFPVQKGIAKYGVAALLDTDLPGKTLMIRSDIDALPVTEETGLPFVSEHNGVMHACGHDGHMAIVMGTATILKKLRKYLKGKIKFIFQPAEEGPGGAKPMIDEGIMENPVVDYSVGCHLWPDLSEGNIGVKQGPLMAAMDRFDIKIIGKGGHGAMPHLCVDALDVGCQVVNALQRLVSRHMFPINPSVVTVGSFHAGSTFNIIPGEAHLSGTTRTFDKKIWNSWPERIEKVVRGVCQSMNANFELDYKKGYPPTVNDAFMAEKVANCAEKVVGKDNVVKPESTMGGEDMAFFLERSKGCYFFLGAGREGSASLHNPRFDFNEDLLLIGVEIYCRLTLDLLRSVC